MSVMSQVSDHYNEALEYFPQNHIVGLFLQGSQNYGLEVANSDVDTKLIITPTFKEIACNKKAISTTHIRANNEHIDFKDIRLYMQTFRKQNLNFLEILFTPYFIVNPIYQSEWARLVQAREDIAHYNPFLAVKTMKGIAMEKYYAMEHRYPTKIEIIEKFGYDPKQLHHLLRVEDFLQRYIRGESYESCLKPTNVDFLKRVKLGEVFSLGAARDQAEQSMAHIEALAKSITKESSWNTFNLEVDTLLDEVQYEIMKTAIKLEL